MNDDTPGIVCGLLLWALVFALVALEKWRVRDKR